MIKAGFLWPRYPFSHCREPVTGYEPHWQHLFAIQSHDTEPHHGSRVFAHYIVDLRDLLAKADHAIILLVDNWIDHEGLPSAKMRI